MLLIFSAKRKNPKNGNCENLCIYASPGRHALAAFSIIDADAAVQNPAAGRIERRAVGFGLEILRQSAGVVHYRVEHHRRDDEKRLCRSDDNLRAALFNRRLFNLYFPHGCRAGARTPIHARQMV